MTAEVADVIIVEEITEAETIEEGIIAEMIENPERIRKKINSF